MGIILVLFLALVIIVSLNGFLTSQQPNCPDCGSSSVEGKGSYMQSRVVTVERDISFTTKDIDGKEMGTYSGNLPVCETVDVEYKKYQCNNCQGSWSWEVKPKKEE